jgi:hypothetical protein
MTTRLPPALGHRGRSGGGASHPISPSPAAIGSSRTSNMSNDASRRQPAAPTSEFCLSLMPRDKIVRRTLHSWNVHYSLTTSKWVATITRPDSTTTATTRSSSSNAHNIRHVQFSFDSERQARKFCWSYAPPKMSTSLHCQMRTSPVPARRNNASSSAATCSGSRHHCRNCGVTICESSSCSAKWGNRMVPKTYIPSSSHHLLSSSSSSSSSANSNYSNNNNNNSSSNNMTYSASSNNTRVVRVCKSCDWLSNAFCMALIQGRYQDALIFHDTVRFLYLHQYCCLKVSTIRS